MPARKQKWFEKYLTWSNAALFLVMPIIGTLAFGFLTGRIKSETATAGITSWTLVGTGLALMIQQFKKKPDAD